MNTLTRTKRERVIGQWQEHINAMRNYLGDFEAALPDITTDEEFMSAYQELSRHCGDVLDDICLPSGTIDDLRTAVTGSPA